LAQTLRFGEVGPGPSLRYSFINYLAISAAIVVLWMVALGVYGTRSTRLLGNGLEESRRVVAATLSMFGVLAVVSVLLRLDIARGYLAIALPAGLLGLLVSRFVERRVVARYRSEGRLSNAVLAVGSRESLRVLAKSFARNPADGLRLVGACGPGLAGDETVTLAPGLRVRVYCDDGIVDAVRKSGADTVVLASGHLTPDEIRDLSWHLEDEGVDLIVAPGMVDVAAPRLTVWLAGGQPLIRVEKPRYNGAKSISKRAFDVTFAALALCATAPVLLIAALAIKLTSRGPVFYSSERVGISGQSFRMLKFRTMVVDAEERLAEIAHLNESDGVLFKMRFDPRVTPVGRLLRRYSIDELPQFFNVLLGHMSVVGPRPPLPREADTYDLRTRRRLLVRPGITGLWQISGRSDLSWEDSVRLDLSYVENWSMIGDLLIAASTAKAVFTASGAY
jgi:exopolysaccharide biosynthesis polyprenyl glycosylphosphotransferase